MYFPTLTGATLDHGPLIIPYGLAGEFNLLLMAFSPAQQFELNSWLPHLDKAMRLYPHLGFHVLATLPELDEGYQKSIHTNLQEEVREPLLRPAMVSLFVDKARLFQALDIPHDRTTYLLLIEREGEIHWRTQGYATSDKRHHLWMTLDRLLTQQASDR